MARKRLSGTPEGEEKRLGILDSAASVFMRKGFAATSLDDISEAYGATKGIIYYHFRNKTVLFYEVLRRAMALTRAAIEPAATGEGSARTRLYAMAFAHTLLIMEHLDYLRVSGLGAQLHTSGRMSDNERAEMAQITAMRDDNEQLYLHVLEEGIAAGEFRPCNARIAVKPLLGALNWTSRWYRPREHETRRDREAIAKDIAEFAVSALLPGTTPKS
ncbi:TetR family transcriptional regulator [Paracandidimonas lactea]|uniref:TetR family transcriptional regulator n=1 Tax=Paracandidimonas lactea TaxID=2895524 RepID=UPI001F011818